MKYRRRIVFVIAFLVLIFNTINRSFARDKIVNETEWYIGINPLAIPLIFSIKPEIKRFLPIASGNEYGATFAVGYFFRPSQSIEGRLSLSNIHQVAFVGQFHLGTNYFLQNNKIMNGQKGWYVGGYAKYWDFYNRQTQIHFHNICPYICLGYMKVKNRFLFDLRLNQTLAVYSWSSLDHTRAGIDWMFSPWHEFIPILPTLTCTISYKF